MVSAKFLKNPRRDLNAAAGAFPAVGDLVQREVDAQLESLNAEQRWERCARNRISDSPPENFCADTRRCAVDFPTAGDVFRLPFVEDVVHYLFDMVEVRLRLQRIINAVVPSLEKFTVTHLGVVAKMENNPQLDQSVRHERAGRNDVFDDASIR